MNMDEVAIIIPIRKNSSRLYNKFFADISGKPMVFWVIDQARKSNIPNIFVACENEEYYRDLESYGVNAVMTGTHHTVGTDRVYEALNKIDPDKKFKFIINLQADVPFISHEYLNIVAEKLKVAKADIVTLASIIDDPEDINRPSIVKIAMGQDKMALYFSRSPIPYNSEIYYNHIGVYGYKRDALEKYVNSTPTILENAERLEQLRALENNLKIEVAMVKDAVLSVDMPEDLEKAREISDSHLV